MKNCIVCGDDQYDEVDGHYFCTTCQTQSQSIRHEENAEFLPTKGLSLAPKVPTGVRGRGKQVTGGRPWQLVEGYQIILKKQVGALIKLGVNPRLDEVVFQIWARFLLQTGNGFNTETENATELKKLYDSDPRDRDIQELTWENPEVQPLKRRRTYQKIKKNVGSLEDIERKQLEETLADEDFYEGDNPLYDHDEEEQDIGDTSKAKEPQYKKSKFSVYNEITRLSMKTNASILYLGLLLCHNHVTAGDLYQWMSEGLVPYEKASSLLPEDMKFCANDVNLFLFSVTPKSDIIQKGTRKLIIFLDMKFIPLVDLRHLASRFLVKLCLPREFNCLVIRLAEDTGPMMDLSKIYDDYPNLSPENVAMAYIVIVIKMLFVLDGHKERIITKYARAVNSVLPKLLLFVWEDWVSFHINRGGNGGKLPRNISEALKINDVTECLENHRNYNKGTRYSEKRGETDRFLCENVREDLNRPLKTFSQFLRPATRLASDADHVEHNSYEQTFPDLLATLDMDSDEMDSDNQDEAEDESSSAEERVFQRSTLKYITHRGEFVAHLQQQCHVQESSSDESDNDELPPGQSETATEECSKVDPCTLKEILRLPHAGCSPYYLNESGAVCQIKSYTTCLEICSEVVSCKPKDLHKWVVRLESKIFHKAFTKLKDRNNKFFHQRYLKQLTWSE